MSEFYQIPDKPIYNDKVRKLQNSDPGNAETVFNPLISQLIENTAAIKQSVDATGPQIVAFASPGSEVTCSDGNTTMSITADSSGRVVFTLPNFGLWKVKTLDEYGDNIVMSFNVDSAIRIATRLSGARVFGVEWDYSYPSTALSRLTPTTDPNGYVTEEIREEPKPAVGVASGSSPFDSFLPWSGMAEYNIIPDSEGVPQVSFKQGESGFARTNDTVVYIPAFYYAVQDEAAGQRRRFYISDSPKEGFLLHPGSNKYIGRYTASGTMSEDYESIAALYSKTGEDPLRDITRAMARSAASAKGAGWSQYDFATYCAVALLYVVEFADWDSQSVIGPGITGNILNSCQVSGLTDSMTYHTGRTDANEEDMGCQVQYRHIESIWGNMMQFIDGINFNERAAYVYTDPSKYADDTADNYIETGITMPTSGFIKCLGISESAPWAIVPNTNGGSNSTFIPDRALCNAGWRILYVGGNYATTGGNAGLFFFSGISVSSFSNSSLGSRLLFHP